jgi:transposase-like protein
MAVVGPLRAGPPIGYRRRDLITRVGTIDAAIPRLRKGT